jgi:hypothetical protein
MLGTVYHGSGAESSDKDEPSLLKCQYICIVNLIFKGVCAINRKNYKAPHYLPYLKYGC